MWPYVVLVLAPIFMSSIRVKNESKKNYLGLPKRNNPMLLFWVFLLLLLILRREDIGRDLGNYFNIFESIARNDWKWATVRSPEIGWNYLNKFVSCFSTDFRWIIIISAILSILFVAEAYIKYSTDTPLTIVLFVNLSCFVMLFSGLRQSIAVSIGLLAFQFAIKKKPIKFLLCVLIAVLFHISAFMLLFIYPLCHVRFKKKHLIWIVPALLLVLAFNQPVFTFLGSILSTFSDYDATIELTGSYTMLILVGIFTAYSFIIPDEEKLDNETMAMRNILLLSLVLQMFAPIHSLAMRMNYYYLVFIPLLIPRINDCRKKGYAQIASIARTTMIVFFLVWFFIKAPKDNVLDTFPFHFFWE